MYRVAQKKSCDDLPKLFPKRRKMIRERDFAENYMHGKSEQIKMTMVLS